jgi:CheY-like chemotaxis protein
VDKHEATHADPSDLGRMELLRLNAARATQSERYAPVTEVIDGAARLAQNLAKQKGVKVHVDSETTRQTALVEKNAVRQVLLETLDFLLGPMEGGRLEIRYSFTESDVELFLTSTCQNAISDLPEQREVDITVLKELAQTQQIALDPIEGGEHLKGFHLRLPSKRLGTVLVVDDNDDMLELFERYLRPHNYGVFTAQTGEEAISLAKSRQPDTIILDLMMPDQDGWDVLQTLSNQPATEHIPIIVCTVLSAKRLALALGAAVFLEKPINEDKLVSTLTSINQEIS